MSFHPQTPQSPSQFSPSTTDPSLGTSNLRTATSTSLPTPAHSVSGSSIPSEMPHDIVMGEDSPQKRKRPLEDLGDREQKKVHIEDGRLGIEALHEDVGEKYLICKTPIVPPSIRTTEDLFEAFNLTGIAEEVARVRPNGDKNGLRKTYKGHIKKLAVNGHFDSVKRDVNDESGLLHLVYEPEDHFNAVHVKSKEISRGLSSEAKGSLLRAMTMARGSIPKSVWDSGVLGELASNKVSADKPSLSSKGTTPNTPLHPAVARTAGQQPAAQDVARPKRSVKKRSYGDSSFEGYGEGFPDDDGGAETGSSTGEGEGPGQKRRRKNPGPAPFPTGPMRQQSYGPGMVGA